MSGICGVLRAGQPAAAVRSAVAPLLADLADFGPVVHEWAAPEVAFGQRQEQIYRRDRLEQQPVLGPGVVLVADARLIRPDRLGAALGLAANAVHAMSDSALILAAWQQWGEAAPDRLEGEFCFALWEAAPRRLTLVRDHLGLRPLYYGAWTGGCAFSTSLAGLLLVPQVDTALDECAIADYLATLASEDVSTPYRGVRRLAPGSVLRSTLGRASKLRRYWHIETASPVRLPRAEDYVQAVRERVDEVIAHCCDTDHGVGLVLSGGLDSSTLAALAARQLAAQGRTLHVASSVLPTGHRGPAQDERTYMEAVCAMYPNIVPHWVTASDRKLLDGAQDDLRRRGQPAWNPFEVMDSALQGTLAQAGARVVMDGLHGDSVWSFEHPVFALDFLLRGRVRTAWREAAALARGYRVGRRTLARLMVAPYGAWLPVWRGDARARLTARTGPTAVSSDLARRTDLARRARRERARGMPWLSLRAAQRVDLANPTGTRLREEIARSAATQGLSLRSPLWDRRVVELCLSAPPEALHHAGYGRALARAVGRDIVPEMVRTRTDKGAFLPDFHARVLRERDAFLALVSDAQAGTLAPRHVDFGVLRAALGELAGEQSVSRWSLGAQAVVLRGVRMACFLRSYESGLGGASPSPGAGAS